MSRASIVGMLIAVELLIVGMVIYIIGGHHRFNIAAAGAGFQHQDFVAAAVAPIAAGDAPRVSIDDSLSKVVVATSSDGQVHVKDDSTGYRFLWGSGKIEQLRVTHSGDGVSIVRPDSGSHLHVGFDASNNKIEVDVPPGAHIDIAHCQGADVSDIHGGVAVQSDDGSIRATNVGGDALSFNTDDGRVTLAGITTASLIARSHDGSMSVSGSIAPNAKIDISTDDGSVRLALAQNADATIDASTDDGSITVDGNRVDSGDNDSVHHTLRLGNGSGTVRLSSRDGSIHITTNGAV
jgi:hypothetical protein